MAVQFFTYQKHRLNFLKSGNGPTVLFAFHGFSQDHRAFNPFVQHVGSQYTVYSFDLFFHGQSTWAENSSPLEKAIWKCLIQKFIQREKIDRFSLLGYSIGAKFALACLEAFPNQIDSITLVAPDGVRTNHWYTLATYPTIFRKIFKSTITHPERFFSLVGLVKKLGLIDQATVRFVTSQMNTEEKRKQVYYSWVVFRHLKFNATTIASIVNKHKIKCKIVTGSGDNIVPTKGMNVLINQLDHPNAIVLDSSHLALLTKWINHEPK